MFWAYIVHDNIDDVILLVFHRLMDFSQTSVPCFVISDNFA